MNLGLTSEQKMLHAAAAAFCAEHFSIERVRQMISDPTHDLGFVWSAIADQGWLGILVPASLGGPGLGFNELGIVLENFGRALAPVPFFSAAALGVPAIALGTSDGVRERHLGALLDGSGRATLAALEDASLPSPDCALDTRAVANEAGFRLTGRKVFVPDLVGATLVVVLADLSGERALFAVETNAPGVTIEAVSLTDSTSRSASLRLDQVQVAVDARLGGAELTERLLEFANVGLAAQCVAASEAVLNQVVEYVKTRTQFGVPIGTFQAVQHPLANLFAEIESARSVYHYAAWTVDQQSSDRSGAVALARLAAAESYRHACVVSLQAHGGIGFTWEYDLHLHLKRAKHNQFAFGMPDEYTERIAVHALGLGSAD